MAIAPTGIAGAIAAYGKVAKNGGPGIEPRDAGGGDSFSSLVKDALQEAKKIGKVGESRSIEAIRDQADMHQVVTAVAEAELTLQTVVNIRDKVIDAYKEILRMPI